MVLPLQYSYISCSNVAGLANNHQFFSSLTKVTGESRIFSSTTRYSYNAAGIVLSEAFPQFFGDKILSDGKLCDISNIANFKDDKDYAFLRDNWGKLETNRDNSRQLGTELNWDHITTGFLRAKHQTVRSNPVAKLPVVTVLQNTAQSANLIEEVKYRLTYAFSEAWNSASYNLTVDCDAR